MRNRRPIIRKRVVDVLEAKIAAVESRVYDSRDTNSEPLWETEEVSALNVLTGEERADKRAQQGFTRTYFRTLDLVIEVAIKNDPAAAGAGKNLAEQLDDMCGAVEEALNDDPTLGCVCESIEYVASAGVVVTQGAKRFATAELKFEVSYVS